MTRAEAVAMLRQITGIADPRQLMEALQLAGLVSDNAIEPKQAATEDLINAAQKLAKP